MDMLSFYSPSQTLLPLNYIQPQQPYSSTVKSKQQHPFLRSVVLNPSSPRSVGLQGSGPTHELGLFRQSKTKQLNPSSIPNAPFRQEDSKLPMDRKVYQGLRVIEIAESLYLTFNLCPNSSSPRFGLRRWLRGLRSAGRGMEDPYWD